MGAELDKDAVAKAYARWAPIYDFVFGAVFERGRKASVAAAERIGGRILEVGVGTGISLPEYRWTTRVVGVDLSMPMLRKAKARVREHGLSNVDGLAVMDAQNLGFEEASFDVVVAQYVITARRIRTRSAARRRDRAGQSSRRRSGTALGVRAAARAAGPPARLAAGIPLGAADALGGAAWRRARRRTARHAAARPFLAHPLRPHQPLRRRSRPSGRGEVR